VIQTFLAREVAERLSKIHALLLEAHWPSPPTPFPAPGEGSGWAAMPSDEPYLWGHQAYHLAGAGRQDELRALLFDFDWLWAKLVATDINALIADYDSLPRDADIQLTQSVLRLSSHVLAQNKIELASQLLGRLLSLNTPTVETILKRAQQWKGAPWLRPLFPCLTPPGGPLLRTLAGHTGSVNAVAVTPDGRYAVSASYDTTLAVWDLERGVEIRTLEGHSDPVNAVAITPDGRCVVSAAGISRSRWEDEKTADYTLKVWDLRTGTILHTFSGHTDAVCTVGVAPDGKQVLSGAADGMLKLWDLETGAEQWTVKGHNARINTVVVTPDGRRAISAASSSDNSAQRALKVWDLVTGAELYAFDLFGAWYNTVVVTPDGLQAVSASDDTTLKVWDLMACLEQRTLSGHNDWVYALAMMPDGKHVVSSSEDRTVKVWDIERAVVVASFSADSRLIGCIITPNGETIIASDASTAYTLRLEGLEPLNH
jgi:WD40 repeat protein